MAVLGLLALQFATSMNLEQVVLKNKIEVESLTAKLESKQSVIDAQALEIESLRKKTALTATVTAYSAEVKQCDSDPRVAASLKKVRPGTVAVSRDLFAKGWTFGRKIYIEGHGIYEINDLMHKRKKKSIDVFIGDTKAAKNFGVKNVTVSLIM